MPTDSDQTRSGDSIATIQTIKCFLSKRWPNLSELFTDENISCAMLQVLPEYKILSDGSYNGSGRLLHMASYDPVHHVEIKCDLYLIKDEIVRATNNN